MPPIDLVSLPAGEVELHDARRKRRWTVRLEPFEIARVPVTLEQYAQLTARPVPSAEIDPQVPLADLSWRDAIALCNAASAVEGLAPAYALDGDDVSWRVGADGYRLPTEAEWEYACRAGTSGPHYAPLETVAWTSRDGVDAPHPVGAKRPNGFGLFDALGNVWEWCWDLLDPARYGDYRVFRGGGFADEAWSVRASTRRGGAPGMSHPDVGLRLARGAFAPGPVVQGWSAEADRERAAIGGPLPSGWTPRGARP
ncbi:formylglycine-generating enzyme family protein [Leucobacter sp. GX0328]